MDINIHPCFRYQSCTLGAIISLLWEGPPSRLGLQQYTDPDRWDPRLRIRNGGSAAGDGDAKRVPARSASPLGRVSEQILRRRWLQVRSFHFHSHRKRRRLMDHSHHSSSIRIYNKVQRHVLFLFFIYLSKSSIFSPFSPYQGSN